ncbi:MAG: copper chaperone [Actinomycetota bacterium]|nr:copper chaperone [Actinomycetota bacterium]
MITTTLHVSGMTCEHCVKAVTDEISALDGVRSVTVGLVPGGTSAVEVLSTAPVPLESLRAAVDEAGYELTAG